MAGVEIRNLEKRFGAVPVLQDLSLDVGEGEFVALVGPSGCGKSTLLRTIAGLETVTGGTIAIDGRVVNGVAAKDRDIAMVFQSYALYPHMTVAQNMGFALRMAKSPQAEIDRRVRAAASILGLETLLGRFPKELSGGQRQRVAMGRAIVRSPKVFLFDEPLSNLDAKLRVEMRAEIKDLHQRLKTTTVYVTHDQVEAMTMASRVVLMRDGRIEQAGAPLELYDEPANLFVASFIGSPSMNVFEGAIDATGAFLASNGDRVSVAGGKAGGAGRPITLGIRPEHLEIVAPDTRDALPATIAIVEPTGSETSIIVNVLGKRATVTLHERKRVAPGEVIHLLASGPTHLFDPATTRRIA